MAFNREIKFRLCRYELVTLLVILFVCLTAAGRVTCLPAELSISRDNGITWQPAGRILPGKPSPVDLTRFVQGSYGYLFKVETSGGKDDVAIKTLEVNTWVQVAPISLPRLKKGTNHLRYEIGDRYSLKTLPMLVQPNTADPRDLKKYVTELPKEYDPERLTARIQGEVIIRLSAPPGTKIAWFSTGATFRTYQGDAAKPIGQGKCLHRKNSNLKAQRNIRSNVPIFRRMNLSRF